MSKSTTSLCAFMVIAAAGALGASGPAAATVYSDTSAGGACHPAGGGAASKFTYSNNYLTNIGTTDQYVICHFGMNDTVTPVTNPSLLYISVAAGGTSGTISCVAQHGSFYLGANHVESSQTRSASMSAGASGTLSFDTSTMTRTQVYNTFTVNCRVPGGFKLALIEYWN
jgi:hypothetical protein